MQGLKLIVCGGRDYADRDKVWDTLDRIRYHKEILLIIQGDCPTGADLHAREWCLSAGIQMVNVPALWDKYGRRAGPMRNRSMLELTPAGVVAFPGGAGTANMVKQAKEAGLGVMEVR